MGIARSGAVEVVNSLEKLGYAARTESTIDKRAHALALTDAGRDALRSITQAIREHDARISAKLTAAEQKELRRLLDSLGQRESPTAGSDCGLWLVSCICVGAKGFRTNRRAIGRAHV